MNARLPWLTLAVFAVTSLVTGAMLVRPEIGTALQRDPLMLEGEWWRFVTTWLVLTDGWVQIVVNSLGLLIFGTLVERRHGRVWWAVAYVVAGLAGAVVASLATFLPCYLFTVIPAPHFKRLSSNASLRAFVDGVTAAATGAIAGASFVLARRALVDGPAVALALATLAVTARYKRVPEPALIAGAGLLGVLLAGNGGRP